MTEYTTPRQEPLQLLYADGAQREFFRGVVLGARNLGFQHCAYLIGVPSGDAGWHYVMTSNFPRCWRESYLRHGYHAIDPTIAHAKTSAQALTWSSAQFDPPLARDARAIGFDHGWTQPLRGAHGEFGVLTLARSSAIDAEELQAKLPMMQWLAKVVHARLFHLFLARQRSESAMRLTERELEILRMAAEGGTAADISALTGVGERTINFHIGNIVCKLGATNKTHAVTLALRLGLID